VTGFVLLASAAAFRALQVAEKSMAWPPSGIDYNLKNYDKYHHLIQYATPGEAKDIKICRCWQSKKFPYCDGSHKALNEAGDVVGPFVVKVNAKPATTNVASNYLQARSQIPRTAAFCAMGFATVGLACAVGLGYVKGFRVHGKVGLPSSDHPRTRASLQQIL